MIAALLLMSLPADCQQFGRAELLGAVEAPGLNEASGLASASDGRHFWSHNDSGGHARLFAIDQDRAAAGTVRVEGANAQDWEDLAAGPCGDRRCIYIGDFGDNGHRRSDVAIYRIVEPAVPPAGEEASAQAERLTLRYPAGPRDAEGLAVDPVNGDLLIVTKLRGEARSEVFRVPAASWAEGEVVPQLLGEIRWEGDEFATLATAADIAPSGQSLYVQTYSQALLIPLLREGETIQGLGEARSAPAWSLGQCEAATFGLDGRTLWFICEGNNPPLAKAVCFDAPPAPPAPEPEAEAPASGCGGCGDSNLAALLLLPLARPRERRRLRRRG